MVPRIDRRGPEQRHHHRLHDKFEGDAKRYADREDTSPTAWGREAERSPGGVRKPRPNEDEDSAQGTIRRLPARITSNASKPTGPKPRSCSAIPLEGARDELSSSAGMGTSLIRAAA